MAGLLMKFDFWNGTLYPPVVWDVRKNVRFQDIKEENWDDAIEFLKREHFGRNTLWKKGLRIEENPAAMDEFCQRLVSIFKDACSIIAIDQDTDAICGVAALRMLYGDCRPWALWRSRPTPFGEIRAYCDLDYLLSSPLYAAEQVIAENRAVMHYFVACMQKKGELLKDDLLDICYNVAQSMGATTVTYFTHTHNDEIRAARQGMKPFNAVAYKEHLNDKGDIIFDKMEPDYTAMAFFKEVEPQKVTSVGGRMSLFAPEECDFSTIVHPSDG